nr:uncharacterized protein LOC109751941 [Aegilops tauschii subsp. strangulata]
MEEIASSSGTANSDLEAMMAELGLKEDELQDVVVDEGDLPEEATRWMAIARVHTEKPYSQYWFYRNMRVAWDLAQEKKIRPLEENLYSMQFSCHGDWERVMEEGPWSFKGKAVVMAPYDGFTKPTLIELNKIEIWIQIHDLPDGFFPKVKALSATVEEFIFAEPKSQDFEGNFVRVRVRIDVTKPLKNDVSLVIRKKDTMERVIFRVKYERLPDWCAVCGNLGHLFKECGDGIHPPKALVFKDLKASWFRGPGRGPGEGSGSRGGRGRGRNGRGGGRVSTQFNPYSSQEHEDTEFSGKDVPMQDAEQNRKRGAVVAVDPRKVQKDPTKAGAATPLMLLPSESPSSPPPKQEQKRNKPSPTASESGTGKNPVLNKNSDARVAGLPGGSRLAQ